MATPSRRQSPPATSLSPAPLEPVPSHVPFLTRQADEVYLVDLAVVPNARRTEVVGLHDQALRIRLAAPPVEGAANDALVRWLADALGVSRQQVSLLRGASGRRKRLRIEALPRQIEAWLACLEADGVLGTQND